MAFMFRATKATCVESILLPPQALSTTSLVFHGVFSERFCVVGLHSQASEAGSCEGLPTDGGGVCGGSRAFEAAGR